MMRACDQCGAELVKKPGPGRRPRRCAKCTPKRDRSKQQHKTPAPICRQCGNPFRKPWGGRNTFCSWACACAGRKGAKRPGRRKAWPSSRVHYLTCPCGALFASRRSNQVRCSDECRKAVASDKQKARYSAQPAQLRTCRQCGAEFTRAYGDKRRVTCSDLCAVKSKRIAKRASNRGRENHRRRARLLGLPYEPIRRQRVFERDGWKCGICRKKINPGLQYPHPKSASP